MLEIIFVAKCLYNYDCYDSAMTIIDTWKQIRRCSAILRYELANDEAFLNKPWPSCKDDYQNKAKL